MLVSYVLNEVCRQRPLVLFNVKQVVEKFSTVAQRGVCLWIKLQLVLVSSCRSPNVKYMQVSVKICIIKLECYRSCALCECNSVECPAELQRQHSGFRPVLEQVLICLTLHALI